MPRRPSHPPIDPEILAQAVYPAGFSPTLELGDILRRRSLAMPMDPADPVEPVTLERDGQVEVEWREIPGPDGAGGVRVVILRPAVGGSGHGILFIHGGGMVMGSAWPIDASVANTVVDHGTVVVSVEYRLAPEHRYPAAVEDCYAALAWTAAHAGELGINPGRLVIAGVSAGGGLAACTALLARDRGGPSLTHQILYCPMLDDRERFPSSTQLDGEGSWDRNANRTGWSALLGDAAGGPLVSPYAAASRATDLTGLPATFIDVGTVETFRDEDIDYATRLSQAGVSVELHVWPGGIHGFYNLAPAASISRGCLRTRRDHWARILAPH